MSKPEDERIASLPAAWRWRPGVVTDPIDMGFIPEEIDVNIRVQLIATRLETAAAVYRSIAEGAAKAAGIISGAKGVGGKSK
jgi:hypothetical protein